MLIIKYIFFCLLLFGFVSSYNFNIEFGSTETYKDYECGGEIDKNQISGRSYPPCKSFTDLGYRIRSIIETDEEDVLNVYIVVNSSSIENQPIEINEEEYLGTINTFSKIQIQVTDGNKEQINSNRVHIYRQTNTFFIGSSSKYPNSSIVIKGLSFYNWNSVFPDSYPVVKTQQSSVYFENVVFFNTIHIVLSNSIYSISYSDVNSGVLSISSCLFTNISTSQAITFIYKTVGVTSCVFSNNNFNGVTFYNGERLVIDQCTFTNNQIQVVDCYNLYFLDSINITISNSNFYNNLINTIVSIKNTISVAGYAQLTNLNVYSNNTVIGDPQNRYLFKLSHSSDNLKVIFKDIKIEDIGSLDENKYTGMIFYSDSNSTIELLNVQSTNINNFKNILDFKNSFITITDSYIPSQDIFINGINNIIETKNSVYNYNDRIINQLCNSLNGSFSDYCSYSSLNSNPSHHSNITKVAIIVPVLLFQLDQKTKNKNNIINEIDYEDNGEIDIDVANVGGDGGDRGGPGPNFLNDVEDAINDID
ncbi:hypothetical protein DICPUDRAFT_149220 [Dictyostelium purpureum]|uniref:Right handed beta helix domain-containing protein n=1 Tax=Dictyostelium purpureum TaxID=5786 RepID=F0ZD44_DICPU|nr:uncharacterized protein DICPUDRAFT_149220 [Dictyostelium purpureum]EGC38138.1 hypothetical protein DICPUDRAFT_149220 [Dictyostelium purpureum]|eukprot:XP_003285352.1 hypothetical protein DICPUDRAFT_149220 [Dictyostelium purpureum]